MSLLSEYKKACAIASAEIYTDIDQKILITQLCLSNIAVAVRYRAEVFGDDVRGLGDFIGTAFSGADMLIYNVDGLLEFGGYFDHSPEKNSRQESFRLKAAACADDISNHMIHCISMADTNNVPDFFLTMPPVEAPRQLLSKRMIGLVPALSNILVCHDLRMAMAKNMIASAEEMMKISSAYEEAFVAEATNVSRLYRMCERERMSIQTFIERLQPNPFA